MVSHYWVTHKRMLLNFTLDSTRDSLILQNWPCNIQETTSIIRLFTAPITHAINVWRNEKWYWGNRMNKTKTKNSWKEKCALFGTRVHKHILPAVNICLNEGWSYPIGDLSVSTKNIITVTHLKILCSFNICLNGR